MVVLESSARSKVADSSKQAILGDYAVTLQNTVDEIEEHLIMSLDAVNTKYMSKKRK